VNAYLNTKIKRTRKLEPKQLSPTKSKRSKSKVHLPSVKGVITSEHPNYSLGEVLGEGAFAKVRIAQRKSDQLKCVIKKYEKSRLKTEERKKSLHK
jgi:serine/threonine protein kinase